MYVEFNNNAGAQGRIGFSGAGSFIPEGDSHLTVDSGTRVITVH
jgi:hypothetical protein